MPSVNNLLNNFVSGEISPKLAGRIDLPQYITGCRTLVNFLVNRTGGIERRPGTYYVAGTPSNNKARLIPFQNKEGTNYVLEFTNVLLRVYKNGAIVESGGTPYSIVSPYATADLFQLKYAVIDGVLWIVHPSYAPRTLTWTSDTSWAFATPTFSGVAFSASGDYPRAVASYAGRAYLASTNNNPYHTWASKPPAAASGTTAYFNFTLGSVADDAIVVVQTDMRGSTIQWIEPARLLVLGTDRSECAAGTTLPTPATLYFQQHAAYGAESVQGRAIQEGVAYVRRGGEQLGLLMYNDNAGGMVSLDLTSFSDHIGDSGFTEIAIQTSPQPIVWAVRTDGTLVSLTFDQTSGVFAFARHEMGGDGLVESIAVIRSGTEDQIWISVLRGTTRTVEYMAPRKYGDLEDAHYVDCGLFLEPSSETVSGLDHLEGQTVTALGDKAVLPDKTVASGEVEYDRVIEGIHIGLAYESILQPTRMVVPLDAGGIGKKKRVEKVTILFYETLGGKIGTSADDLETIVYRDSLDWETALPLFSGEKVKTVPGKVDTSADLYLVQDQPYPMTILALVPTIGIMEA